MSLGLKDLYVDELTDLFDAEQQALRELPLLAAAAGAAELRAAFEAHYRETLSHVSRLESVFEHLDERPRRRCCRPLQALIEDGRAKKAAVPPGAALDAALISFGQRLEHFEIAAYRSVLTYALAVGDAHGAELIQQTLGEEDSMDRQLLALSVAPANVSVPVPVLAKPTLVFPVDKAS